MQQTMRLFALFFLLAACLCVSQGQGSNPQRPNIVMLMTDDTGWGDFGAYSGGGLADLVAQVRWLRT